MRHIDQLVFNTATVAAPAGLTPRKHCGIITNQCKRRGASVGDNPCLSSQQRSVKIHDPKLLLSYIAIKLSDTVTIDRLQFETAISKGLCIDMVVFVHQGYAPLCRFSQSVPPDLETLWWRSRCCLCHRRHGIAVLQSSVPQGPRALQQLSSGRDLTKHNTCLGQLCQDSKHYAQRLG